MSICIRRLALALCGCGWLIFGAGCTTTTTSSPSPYIQPRSTSQATDRLLDPIDHPSGRSLTLHVRVGLLPLGLVPFDGFMLPLISPDGQYIATQTDAPPAWPTVLAEPGATPPYATSIMVYRLDARSNIDPAHRHPPTVITRIEGSVVLGRGCDADGFLVESPREDGSRWIGKASWHDGAINWLIRDEMVNAFACLSVDGRLAWSRRTVHDNHFDLAVRESDGSQWIVAGSGGDWLMPAWSSVSNGLYAFHRQDSQLRLCYGPAQGERSFRAAMRDFLLIAHSDKYAAYQAMVSQGGTDSAMGVGQPQLFLLHPGLGRMIVWKPFAPRASAATLLNDQSLVALQHNADSVIIALQDKLVLQSLRDPDASILLNTGLWVPRRSAAAEMPYMLLSPQDDGMVSVAAMTLLPIDPSPSPRR